MAKGWTEERRKKQAEIIRKNKPWEKSTGPKTQAGRARSSINALKNGNHSAAMKELRKAILGARAFNRHIYRHMVLDHIEKSKKIGLKEKQRMSMNYRDRV